MNKRLNVIFMGTPIFGKIVLEKLCQYHNVVAVVCPLDKPNKRGNKIVPCAVKEFAIQKRLTLYQYERVNNAVEELSKIKADLLITASFGQLINQKLIDMCPMGTLNVHGSLLPCLRGASPVAQAILNGQKTTGVTIMRMTLGMDEGNMLLKKEVAIGETETASELMEKLAKAGADILIDTIAGIQDGSLKEEVQDNNLATYCTKIKPENAKIDWSKDAMLVAGQINGYSSEPGAYFEYDGNKIKVLRAKVNNQYTGKVGEILESSPKTSLIIGCGVGAVEAIELQSAGGKRLPAKDFLNGRKFEKGTIIQ